VTKRGRWRKINRWTIQSPCGRYNISRSGAPGTPHERFSVWRLAADDAPPRTPATLLRVVRSAQEAREVVAEAVGPPR